MVMSYIIVVIFILGTWAERRGLSSIGKDDADNALIKAFEKLNRQKEIESQLITKRKYINPFTPSTIGRHQVSSCSIESCPEGDLLYLLEYAAIELVNKFNLKKHEVPHLFQLFMKSELVKGIENHCLNNRPTRCVNSKYRTIDGNCNNLQRPNEGRSFSCHIRFLPPVYADGVNAPRRSVDNLPLPEPRTVTQVLNEEICMPGRPNSNFLMVFGQFLDHDNVLTKQTSLAHNAPFNCCLAESMKHPQCLPAPFGPSDPEFPNVTCMNFPRDRPCDPCSTVREHLNAKTPVIDCSQVYGAVEEDVTFLRTNSGDGKLRVTTIEGVGDVPPPNRDITNDMCTLKEEGYVCPMTGDIRSNQHPLLLSIHTIFLRFHNYVADNLHLLNPHWDGETIYQEARRIVGAVFQHISYCHYLPKVVGFRLAEEHGLCEDETKYDSTLPIALFNAFPTSIFRFAHSTVPDEYLLLSENGSIAALNVADVYFDPRPIFNGLLEDIIRGSVVQNQEEFDRCLEKVVRKNLYKRHITALDLSTINIQRGRDHGLPGFVAFYEYIFGGKITSFEDLPMKQTCKKKFKSLYRHVEDIDLFAGILCEIPEDDAIVGPVSAFIIAKQYFNLKFGDRYYHTHLGEIGSFTKEQRGAIRSVSMSTIVCAVTKVKRMNIDMLNTDSIPVPCTQIPKLNFLPWKD
ncbi:chorion peroxidase-like isoform X2 [Centruroides vittatus]|uniref:chorion peroxidase-like isoform X2 n=1 Tax=Centruroides vittatus TaxID=120091 RepID=UPI00350F9E09